MPERRRTMLELWAGPECTVNRVGECFRDQFVDSGHDHRVSDLDLFAALGIKALRYPVLWERIAPDRPNERDWTWSDARLARLRELQIRPIVGLVHHGSGPHYT
ncbi:MAG: glycosyl hydrolase family protein, partial [Zymomonas sp.]